ncbi:hypothetical protein R1sor_003461 [Riccia sorocarpa]|uniref:Uncharacterized protein n=1 Tax=Riccia sorocarpa TaxID=122646 RepID=A0ABD3H4I5_9MARC
MESDFDALVAARRRIKELEDMVADLREKIKMMEAQKLSLGRSISVDQASNQSAATGPSLESNNMEKARTRDAIDSSPEKGGGQDLGGQTEILQETDAREQQNTRVSSISDTNSRQVRKGKKASVCYLMPYLLPLNSS